MKYLFLLLSTFLFSQETVSTFMELDKKLFFIDNVNSSTRHYLLTLEKIKKEKVFYWKVFDDKFIDTKEVIPLTINGSKFYDFFPNDAALLIEQTENSVKKVTFLKEEKGKLTLYSGKLDANDLSKGIYNVGKKYTKDFSEIPLRKARIFRHDNHFIYMCIDKKNHYTFYKFTEEENSPKKFYINNNRDFIDSHTTFYQGNFTEPNISSRYFPDGKSIFFDGNEMIFVYPKKSDLNKGIMTKNPLKIIRFDLDSDKTTIKDIDIPNGIGLDYALVDHHLYVACQTKSGVEVHSYSFESDAMESIHTIASNERYQHQFIKTRFYLDNSRNRSESSSFEKWERDMKQTLVLDVDKLDNGLLEFTISGAKYRDPDGFAKVLGAVLIGGLTGGFTGVGIVPDFGYGKLQPLLTSTSFVLFPEDNTIQPIEKPKNIDNTDKFIMNNGYFSDKTLVGTLSENVLVFKSNYSDLYIVVDFDKKFNLLKKPSEEKEKNPDDIF